MPEAPLRERLVRPTAPVARYHLLPVAALLSLVFAGHSGQATWAITGVSGAVLMVIAWPILVWRSWRRNRAGRRLGGLLVSTIESCQPLDAKARSALEEGLRDPRVTEADREYQCKSAYLFALEASADDRIITDDELRLLSQLEEIFGLSEDFVSEARIEIFRESYFEAIADHDLTDEEESALEHIRSKLEIPASAIEAELEMIERLRELRHIRAGQLPEVKPTVRLQKAEKCYCEYEGRLLKEKTLESFQSEGQRYRVRGLVAEKEGTLCVTSKRVLLVHDSTTSIRLDKILDVDVDCDQNLITIVKDGARAPTYLSTPDALRTAAIVATAAGI